MQITGARPQAYRWETLGVWPAICAWTGLTGDSVHTQVWEPLVWFLWRERKEQRQGNLSAVITEACWVTMETPLLLLNRKQPSMHRAPQRIRGNSSLSFCEGHCCRTMAKGDDLCKVQRKLIETFGKTNLMSCHNLYLVVYLSIYFLGFWGEERAGEFLNHSKGHNMLEGNTFFFNKIMPP